MTMVYFEQFCVLIPKMYFLLSGIVYSRRYSRSKVKLLHQVSVFQLHIYHKLIEADSKLFGKY